MVKFWRRGASAPQAPPKSALALNTCLKDRYTLIEQSDLNTLIEQSDLNTLIEQSDLNTLIEQSQYSSEEQCSKLIYKEIWLARVVFSLLAGHDLFFFGLQLTARVKL